MGVEQKFVQIQQEKVKPLRRPDIRHSLPPEIRKLSETAEEEMNAAEEFLSATGIKLALFEFNQDLLGNIGRVTAGSMFHYSEDGEGRKLVYHSNLILTWGNSDTNYSLVVGVDGNLMDTFEDEYGGEDYTKNLTLRLFQGNRPGIIDRQIGPCIDFGSKFDIYDPNSLNDSSVIDQIESEKDVDKYIEMGDKEGTKNLGGNVYKNWVEANIAGFISFMQREMQKSPLPPAAS